MNGSHFFLVTARPTMVTASLRIIPSHVEKRACFKLEIKGCDPKGKHLKKMRKVCGLNHDKQNKFKTIGPHNVPIFFNWTTPCPI